MSDSYILVQGYRVLAQGTPKITPFSILVDTPHIRKPHANDREIQG